MSGAGQMRVTVPPRGRRRRWRRMEILRYIVLPALAGSLAGLIAVAGLLALDVGSLRTLIFAASDGWVALLLLCVGFVVTFGSAAIGAAVMSLGQEGGFW